MEAVSVLPGTCVRPKAGLSCPVRLHTERKTRTRFPCSVERVAVHVADLELQ